MKQTTVNEFKDGLNLDLHPLVTPKTVLTDDINGTFITYNGNEFCLQNDRGNEYVTSLTQGYTPIGIKEHNGVLYIVSVNGNATEIGTFPSPNYTNVDLDQAYNEEWEDALQYEYAPLHVLNNHRPLTGIDLDYTTETPVTIEIQDSYDGSVNLIIVANERKPRIINSGFSVLPDDRYKFINRRQSVNTNVYDENTIDEDTELIRTTNIITKIDLIDVKAGGQFTGGNYTFYIKYGDADFNQTDVVAESGIVSIFKGTVGKPSTISGTLADERTDKMIGLKVSGLNPIYSKIYIYYTREYSDVQGFRLTEAGMFKEPVDIKPENPAFPSEQQYQNIWLTGFEQQVPIHMNELNVDYHTVDWARAEAQHSNMLFLGNVGQAETFALYHALDDFSKGINTSIKQEFLKETAGDAFSDANYYSTTNIYYQLGYWPDEYYRFGVVYMLDDGSTTPVFNMKGYVFTSKTEKTNENDYGVFRTPNVDVLVGKQPLCFQFTLPDLINLPQQYRSKVMGWFVVRQKRIPITICQSLAIGTDKRSHLPVIENNKRWYIESFLSLDRDKQKGEKWDKYPMSAQIKPSDEKHILRPFLEMFEEYDGYHNKPNFRFIKEYEDEIDKNALLSLDPCVNSTVRGMFDGSQFELRRDCNLKYSTKDLNGLLFEYAFSPGDKTEISNCKTVFVQEDTKYKVLDDNNIFSNIAGTGTSAGDFEYTQQAFGVKTQNEGSDGRIYAKDPRVEEGYGTLDYYGYNSTHNVNLIRGIFTPYIGINKRAESGLYSIRLKANQEDQILVRCQDNSEYYAITNRMYLSENTVKAYRGDCYICKVGIRMLKNFIDNTAPVTNTIVDPAGWEKYVRQRALFGGDDQDNKTLKFLGIDTGIVIDKDVDSYASDVDYTQVNLSDLNAVDLGYWVTFPCLSSYNLGLRSVDSFHVDEMALMGSERSFYPLSGAIATSKVGDSYLLNDGLSATVGRKYYNLFPKEYPYSRSEFANRIMFSNVNITDAFTNGYRTFQGLSYKDYDKQYGAITKLVPLGQNLFVVMEHGLGLVPVNPKALMQTTTGEAIHIYGYGVLPDEMTIISQDYGSKYEHSVIRTPIGIYGVDVDARKIWRFSDKQGFETISDMRVETYLNDNLNEAVIDMGLKDIRTHYNAKKGDLMFTFYTINQSEREDLNKRYFSIDTSNITMIVGRKTSIPCHTNISDSDVIINHTNNISVVYENKTLTVQAIAVGDGQVIINGNTINVRVEESDMIPTLMLSRDSIIGELENTYQLTATSNIIGAIFNWQSSNPSAASVNESGLVTVNDYGSAIITVSIAGTDLSASCVITIDDIAHPDDPMVITGITILPGDLDLYIGQTTHVVATNIPSGRINNNIVWSTSQNPPFKKVGNDVTAINEGVGRLIATTEDEQFSNYIQIKCLYDEAESMQLATENVYMSVNEEYPLNVRIVCKNSIIKPVNNTMINWTSSDSGIARIEWKNDMPTICAYAPGTVTITGTYLNQSDVTATCNVTVGNTDIESEINYGIITRTIDDIGRTTPGGPIIYMTPGDTQVFETLANYVTHRERYPANWSISNNDANVISFESEPAVGDLQTTIKANALGTANLTLEFRGNSTSVVRASYTWTINVVEEIIPSRRVTIVPNPVTLAVGEKTRMIATVYPSNTTYNTVVWSMPQGATARVDDSGIVTGVNVGGSRIIATASDGNSSAWVTATVTD